MALARYDVGRFVVKRMQALILNDQKQLAVQSVPMPMVRRGYVLVKIQAAGIGGSEYQTLQRVGVRPLPHIMGHSISGTTQQGRRITIYPLQGCQQCSYCDDEQMQLCEQWSLIGVHSDGGLAQYITVPEAALVPLPEDMPWQKMVWIEPFANALNAWEVSGANQNSRVAILGTGSIGLGLTARAGELGCRMIHVCDLSSQRLAVATSLGAHHAATALKGAYDVVFDTIGSHESRQMAIDLATKNGCCVFIGFADTMQSVDMARCIREQKQLRGAFVFNRQQFNDAIRLVQRCRIEWVTSLSLDEVENQLRNYLAGNFSVVKAAVFPNG